MIHSDNNLTTLGLGYPSDFSVIVSLRFPQYPRSACRNQLSQNQIDGQVQSELTPGKDPKVRQTGRQPWWIVFEIGEDREAKE